MMGKKTLERHAALVDGMAERVKIDLEEAVLRGKMEIDDIAEAVIRCVGCPEPDKCEELLRLGEGRDVPEFCTNLGLFRELGVDI